MKSSLSQGPESLFGDQLFERAPIGLAVTAGTTKFVRVNPSFCRFLGYSKQELLGKTVREITYPDDWTTSEEFIRKYCLTKTPTKPFEKRYRHKNGQAVWGEVSLFDISDGRHAALCTMAQVVDITERKQAEESLRLANECSRRLADQFRKLAENSPDIIARCDRKFHHLYANPAGFKLLGLPAAKVIGKTIRETGLAEPYSSKWEDKIRRVFRLAKPMDVTDSFPSPTGVQIFESRCVPEFNQHGRVETVLVISRNVTKRKQLEEALQKANEELEQKVKDRTTRLRQLTEELTISEHRERRRIAYVLHEQVQQDLCGLKYRASQLKEDSSTPAIIGWADRMVKELDDVIQLTRTLTTDLHPMVLSHLGIRAAMEWLATDIKEKMGLSITVRTDKRVPMITGELKMFVFEAVRELLLNVVKHAKVKRAELLFSSMGANRVKFQVMDKGVGFDPKQNHKRNSHFGHFSIQERVELLGGSFEVSSHPGKGTCATLILPTGKGSH